VKDFNTKVINNMINLKNTKVKLSFSNNEISSNGGIFLYQEFLQKIELEKLIAKYFHFNLSFRKHKPSKIICQKILSIIAGFEDNIDARIIKKDPVFKLCLKNKIASQPTLSRLENRISKQNIKEFYTINSELLHNTWRYENDNEKLTKDKIISKKNICLDVDSTEIICHGKQKGSKFHGYHKSVMYNPLFLFNSDTKDIIKGMLRHGSCADHHKIVPFLEPEIKRLKRTYAKIKFRSDAGFNSPLLYEFLESNNIEYAIRLSKNSRLYKKAEEILPTQDCVNEAMKNKKNEFIKYSSFSYKADSWQKSRLVYVKQHYKPNQLIPVYYFILSNIQEKANKIFDFYNQRGACENYIKEGKLNLSFARLSCNSFNANSFRLQQSILAYNVNNIFRRLILPFEFQNNFLSTIRWKIINIGCRIIHHARITICKFGSNFRQEKIIKWIIERLQLFKLNFI